ncbi:unnamed protein product [marine sediment metagenome]|uniref:Uncharacterized protein n=1 Tax=marine sediment metagenome TaxID=412755 RepID=X0Z9X2_9ZZZZ
MGDNTIIKNKAEFEATAETFLDKIFSSVLENNLGDIEIRTFPKGQRSEQHFCQTAKDASEIAFNLSNSGIDVYFGVNPRIGKRGKKENVHYVTAFHAEIDYGTDGHKKGSEYESYDEAIKAIEKFQPQPTLINHSGGGQKFIFSESSAMCKSKKQYQQQSNSALEFIECCVKDSNPEDSPLLKTCMIVIRDFAHLKEIGGVFPKKSSDLSWRMRALKLPIPASMQTSCGYSE